MEIKERIKNKFKEFFDAFNKAIKRPEMSILPGQLAFYYVLAIMPTLTLISYGASLLNLSTDIIYTFLKNVFSHDIAKLLLSTSSYSGLTLVIIIVVGYYISSNGAASIIVTSNTIYGIKNESFLKRRLKSIFMTFLLILLFIFILLVPVFGNKIIELVSMSKFPRFTSSITKTFNILQGPLAWIIIYLFIKLIYVMAPNRKIKFKNVGYGALFTSIGWIIATDIYSFYITNYSHYSALYGSLANIVILMLWFFLLAYIFTIGIALNYRKEERELEKTGTIKIQK